MVSGETGHTGLNGGLLSALKNLMAKRKEDILVGVPAEKTLRVSDTMNNASLLFIHTNGSPIRGIPARPVIEPALKYHNKEIQKQIRGMLKAAAEGNETKVSQYAERIGMAGQNAVRDWFTNPANGWPPNEASTIAKKGSSKPLIDTGALRKSIIYVIRGEHE